MNAIGFITVLFLAFMNLSCVTPKEGPGYYEALQEAASGNLDFAFLELNSYLRENPDSYHAPDIKFAVAEYHLGVKNYREAIDRLSKYIIDYPEEQNALLAQILLYKALIDFNPQSPLLEKLKERLFSKSIFLFLSDSKTKLYKSLLNNKYKIIEYVDRIEVLKNDEAILRIAP